jgi:hypothetical protein
VEAKESGDDDETVGMSFKCWLDFNYCEIEVLSLAKLHVAIFSCFLQQSFSNVSSS